MEESFKQDLRTLLVGEVSNLASGVRETVGLLSENCVNPIKNFM